MARHVSINNDQDFLKLIFGDDWPHAEICSVPVLGQDEQYKHCWNTTPAGKRWKDLNPDWNNYFCVSTMTVPWTRRKLHFKALHVLVVDDVGPKVVPAMVLSELGTPTYRLETSPGNEQWGYVLDPPITDLSRAESLIDRTIQLLTGGKDPGMKGVTRLMRLPFGSNTKYTPAHRGRMVASDGPVRDPADLERNLPTPAQAQAIQPDPGDPFDAFGTFGATSGTNINPVPGQAVPASPRQAAPDPTLRAMRRLGLVQGNERKASQGTGWDVTCPWVHEHTPSTAINTGTFYFRGGGFKCWHGHCDKRSPEDVRARVNELLSEATGGLFSLDDFDPSRFDAVDPDKVPPSPLPPEPAAVREFWDDTVWVAPIEKFHSLSTEMDLTEKAFNGFWRQVVRDYLPKVGKTARSLTPAQWYQDSPRRRVAVAKAHAPGGPRLFTRTNAAGTAHQYLNTWHELARHLKHVPDADLDAYVRASDWWLLMDLLCGTTTNDQRENARRLRVLMAMTVGAVGHKPGWVAMLIGPQGVGKELIWAPLMKALGPSRATVIDQGGFTGTFNPWMRHKLVQLPEMRRTTKGTATDHDQYAALKRVCDVTHEWIIMNDKNEKHIHVRNVFTLVITSNELRPVSVPPDDRRLFVVHVNDPGWPNARYFNLAKWMDALSLWGGTNAEAVTEWLIRFWDEGMMLDEMQGHAPMNPDKLALIERGTGPVDGWLIQTLGRQTPDVLALPDIFTAEDIVDRLHRAVRHGGEGLSPHVTVPSADSMGHMLSRVGCRRLHNGNQLGARKLRLWAKPNADARYDTMSGADLLREYGSP